MKSFNVLFFSAIIVFLLSAGISCDKLENTSKVDEKEILNLVNDIREEGCTCGDQYYAPVEPVSWNRKLEKAAQKHSDDMYKNDNLNHTGSDNSSPGDRLTEVGYEWNTYGENIAQGYGSEQEVISGWLSSTGHCKNIMNENVTEMAVARKGSYWTQVFASAK